MNPPPLRRRRWLHAVWAAWGVLALAWIAAVERIHWTPAHWPARPVAWWTGDRMEHRPLAPMRADLREHAEVVRAGGEAWFRVQPLGAVELGRLAERSEAVTWAFWLRAPASHPLAAAIVRVARGSPMLDPTIARRVLDAARAGPAAEAPASVRLQRLTPQERRTLALLGEGRTNKEIAGLLRLGEGTVRNCLTVVFSKLGVASRTEAVALWLRR